MTIRQVKIDWFADGNFFGQNVIYFAGVATNGGIQSRTGGFLSNLEPSQPATVTAQVQGEVKDLDETTGDLVSLDVLTSPPSSAGTNVDTDRLADATQGMITFETGGIVNNRLVKGRVYVPGFAESENTLGEPNVSAIGNLNQAGAALQVGSEHVVWSRPVRDASGALIRPGSQHIVTMSTAFPEWGVMRSRRRA